MESTQNLRSDRRGPHRVTSCLYDDRGVLGHMVVFAGGVQFRASCRWGGELFCSPFYSPWDFPRGTFFYWREEIMSQFLRRIAVEAEGGLRHERAVDEAFAQDYPALAEHLTVDWLEGAVRLTSTLGISVDAGQWKARLADRDNGLVCFVSADGFYAVLDALEQCIAQGVADWRVDQYSKPKATRKKG